MRHGLKHFIHILKKQIQDKENCLHCVREVETDMNYIMSRLWRLKDMRLNKAYWYEFLNPKCSRKMAIASDLRSYMTGGLVYCSPYCEELHPVSLCYECERSFCENIKDGVCCINNDSIERTKLCPPCSEDYYADLTDSVRLQRKEGLL